MTLSFRETPTVTVTDDDVAPVKLTWRRPVVEAVEVALEVLEPQQALVFLLDQLTPLLWVLAAQAVQ